MSYEWFTSVATSLMLNVFVDVVKTLFMELVHLDHRFVLICSLFQINFFFFFLRLLYIIPAWIRSGSTPLDVINAAYFPPSWMLEFRLN
jgi:hypothetical protein